MEQIGAGRVVGPVVDVYPQPREPKPLAPAPRAAGAAARADGARRGRRAHPAAARSDGRPPRADGWDVLAPTFRVDLAARGRSHRGSRPPLRLRQARADVSRRDRGRAAARSAGRRAIELVRRRADRGGLVRGGDLRHSSRPTAAHAFAADGCAAAASSRVANPLSAKFDMLRPSLLPGLVDAVAHNRRHGRRDVALFEIGARFTVERRNAGVALAWTGSAARRALVGAAARRRLLRRQGRRRAAVRRRSASTRGFEPAMPAVSGRRARRRASPSATIAVGIVGQLAPAVVERRGAPRQDKVFVAELDLDRLAAARAAAERAQRAPLPRYPFVVRDLSIVVAETLPAEIIRGTIQAAGDAARRRSSAIGVLRSVSRQRCAGRIGQPLGAADVSGDRSHADRRRGAAEFSTRFCAALGHGSTAPCRRMNVDSQSMAKDGRQRTSVELEPIDRLEEKSSCSSAWSIG